VAPHRRELPVAAAAVGFDAGKECAAMAEAAAWLLPGASSRSDSLPRASRRRMRRSAVRARSRILVKMQRKLERRRPVGLARDGGGAAAQTMWSGAMEDGCKLATDRQARGRSVRAPPHVPEAGYGGEEKSLGPSWLVRSGHGVASFAAVRGGD